MSLNYNDKRISLQDIEEYIPWDFLQKKSQMSLMQIRWYITNRIQSVRVWVKWVEVKEMEVCNLADLTSQSPKSWLVDSDVLTFPELRHYTSINKMIGNNSEIAYFLIIPSEPELTQSSTDQKYIDWLFKQAVVEATAKLLSSMFNAYRPAFGYESCPNHSYKRFALKHLDAPVELTPSNMIIPEISICGLLIPKSI